ncbi:hypothetical protein Mmc1_2052 [Magnetococcus marinus MC-1]|uniref:Uncharacterized protein n=1 Tax=Magnetococcus marinus (strain ATCC BAA-1437 / JCM 17883 / MC-1) TaxID=156889 RepID=A0L9B0_MAGMM|nr:hypothetical protein [Magnetococcus marinus]ABK44553.1 hypothetical protein Mmc1_2052 [Magnetococcus marinus MC-1]
MTIQLSPTQRTILKTAANRDNLQIMPLPTNNPSWGFWGTSRHNGYDQEMTWLAASHFFANSYNLDAQDTRDLLDSVFGRHLADDLSFIEGGPTTPEAITDHLAKRMANRSYKSWIDDAVHAIQHPTR